MNGIRFYEDFQTKRDKRKQVGHGQVISAIVGNGIFYSPNHDETGKPIQTACYDAIAAVYAFPNSPVAGSSVALDYLQACCKRISEAHARTTHPQLFVYLDETEKE